MTTIEFESLLDRCCEILTAEAQSAGFSSSKHFENRVREVLSDLTVDDTSIEIDFNLPAQAFTDIAMGDMVLKSNTQLLTHGGVSQIVSSKHSE
ncbi:MAG: hypothetical protein NC452_08920 [Eubacterium sp.]|nr:hypothetical protein [Eubacterium sp.]